MPKSIVTAIDGSENAQRAIEAASDLAKTYNAKLFLVHVVGSGSIPPALVRMAEVEHMAEQGRAAGPQNVANVFGNLATAERASTSPVVAHEIHQALGERLLQRAVALAKSKGAKSVDVIMKEGDPAQAILEAAKQTDADLVVAGTRGLSDLKGLLLGSVSHKVIQFSPCACLLVK